MRKSSSSRPKNRAIRRPRPVARSGRCLRVGILSDTHGRVHPGILRQARGLDWIVHAGDICSLRGLAGLRPRLGLVAVAGNNDLPRLWPPEERTTCRRLAQSARLPLPGGLLAVEHGHRHGWNHPSHRKLRRAHPDARLVVYGHTHRRTLDTRLRPWVLNPGAAGTTRTHGGPSMALLLACGRRWSVRFLRV